MKSERIKHVEERPARGETRAERPQRVPINGERDILAVKGVKEGMHAVWVNESNVPRFKDAGYTFVDYDVSFGSYDVHQGNVFGARHARNVGNGTIAFLMEIPQEWYDQDRKAEEDALKASEGSMYAEARDKGLDHGTLVLPK